MGGELSKKGRVFITVSLLLFSQPARGWGPYAHQQIQRLAARSVFNPLFRKWLLRNEATGLRMAMTPDIDWKVFKPTPSDPVAAAIQQEANRFEAPTHFFDAEVFSEGALATGRLNFSNLNKLTRYSEAAPLLAQSLVANRLFLAQFETTRHLIHWDEPLRPQLPALGSAPWRVLDLVEHALNFLSIGHEYEALLYLSTLGHYLSDLTVPFHTSAFFDGTGPDTKGVHLAFEMKTLDWIAAKEGSARDSQTELYSHFFATEGPLEKEIKRLGPAPAIKSRTDLLRLIFNLIGENQSYLQPLTAAYGKAKKEYPDLDANWAGYLDQPIVVENRSLTVRQATYERMAIAVRALTATWEFVFSQTAKPAPGSLLSPLYFDLNRTIYDYPTPYYLSDAFVLANRLGQPTSIGGEACIRRLLVLPAP